MHFLKLHIYIRECLEHKIKIMLHKSMAGHHVIECLADLKRQCTAFTDIGEDIQDH